MKLSILIPAYNEENTIKELIEKVKKVKLPIKKEIIVVDDKSNDKTLEILKKVRGIKLIRHEKNVGKGFAIRTAIKHSTGEIIIIQDADLEYEPEDYNALIKPIIEGKEKVVYGSRVSKKGNRLYTGLIFYLGGNFLTHLTNLLYPNAKITDEPTCYKVFKADLLKNMKLNCKRFEFCPEVTAKILKQGIKIHEVPISYYPRSIKEGKKINWRDGIEAIWTLIRYRIRN